MYKDDDTHIWFLVQSFPPLSAMSEQERSISRSLSPNVPHTVRRRSSRCTGPASSPPSPASATQPSTGWTQEKSCYSRKSCLLTDFNAPQRRHHQHRREGHREEDGRAEHLQRQQLQRRALALSAKVEGVVCCLRYWRWSKAR